MVSFHDFNIPSPVDCVWFEGKRFFVKRDDLLHPHFDGNKARKLWFHLHNTHQHITNMVSWGGSQSNMMYSLSVLAMLRGWTFTYYGRPLSKVMKQQSTEPVLQEQSNYRAAIANGMQYIETTDITQIPITATDLVVPLGGAEESAKYGLQILAQELNDFIKQQNLHEPAIFVASGTGSTAFYLQQYLSCKVVTTPCATTAQQLTNLFEQLPFDNAQMPMVVDTQKRYHFGNLYPELYVLWQKLFDQTGIVFDLLYDPKAWLTLLEWANTYSGDIIYLHCGGTRGNSSMINRYQRKKYEL